MNRQAARLPSSRLLRAIPDEAGVDPELLAGSVHEFRISPDRLLQVGLRSPVAGAVGWAGLAANAKANVTPGLPPTTQAPTRMNPVS